MVKVLRSFVRGPLEPHIVGFAEELLGQGYTRASAEQHVCFLAHLDRWMSAEGVGLDGLDGRVIERYLSARRAAGYVQYRSVRALRPLLAYLTPLGVLPVAEKVVLGPVEELLGRYRAYLISERGLTVGTARGYVDFVRPFVATRLRGGVIDLAGMRAADVTGFVLGACPGRAVGSAKLIVCALRSLLRWLHLSGQVPSSMAAGVPPVAGWRLSSLPKGLEPGQLRQLLASCDRRTRTGRRDYAPARSPGSGSMTSTGGEARSPSWARATAVSGCRCRQMWARRSRRICAAAGRPLPRAAACSSGCMPRTVR
jgi:integrase